MAFQNFQRYETIENELLEQKLIATPPSVKGGGFIQVVVTPQMGIRDLFKTTQSAMLFSFNAHPAIRMIVEWMKSKFDRRTWDDKRVKDQVFASIDLNAIPGKFSVGSIDNDRVVSGGVALLIKAFYNTCRDYDDHINMDKCNQTVADVNTHIWQEKISFLIQYYRQAFGVDNFSGYKEAYKALLLSKPFKTLKQFHASKGTWLDANLEMFHHLVKLAACGATDDEIDQTYRDLTTIEPILDGSTFGEIYPGHWRMYEGWLSKGYLDWGDLGAQNLDAWHAIPTYIHGAMPQIIKLVEVCVQGYGYWKAAPSSSCFSGSSQVRMASGETKAIRDVQIGDSVLSSPLSADGKIKYRDVAFVSKPGRGDRCLYEHRQFPGIHFTSTHPILMQSTGEDSNDEYPIIQFVNSTYAISLNPTWQSFQTVNMDQCKMLDHKRMMEGNEPLYDLILEPIGLTTNPASNRSLPTYTMVSSNGKILTTMSEAPFPEWFPLELIFIGNVINAIDSSLQETSQILQILDTNSSSLQSKLRKLPCETISSATASATSQISLSTLLRTGKGEDAQVIAAVVEKLIARLGRTIGKVINTGWLKASSSSSSSPDVDKAEVIFLHILRRLDAAHLRMRPPISSSWSLRLRHGDDLEQQCQLDGHVQGQDTLILHRDILLQGSKKTIDTNNTTTPLAPLWVDLELAEEATGTVWRGRGPLQYGVQSMISVGDLNSGDAGSHAVVEVELCLVPLSSLESRPQWEQQDREAYAAQLGYAFGVEIVEELGAVRQNAAI